MTTIPHSTAAIASPMAAKVASDSSRSTRSASSRTCDLADEAIFCKRKDSFAPRSDRDKAANRGTQVHTFAEQLAAGREVEVPEELTGHVDSYLEWRRDWEPTDEMIELVVLNRQWRYMGRLDLICTMAGERWLLDIKTNRSGPFAETALQLAAYRHAESYIDPADPTREIPMPQVDRCGVVWVRGDGYDLFPYEAGPDEFRSFLYVAQVAAFMDRDLFDLRGEPIYPGAA